MKENQEIDEKYNDKGNYPDYVAEVYSFTITNGVKPIRIDKYLSDMIQNSTRTKVQKAIDEGRVKLNGEVLSKSNYKVRPDDKIICIVPKSPPMELRPENIPLNIVFEDEHLLVLNKPAGMVVHPGLGNRYGTMVNALLYHFGQREAIKIEFDEQDEEGEELSEGKLLANEKMRPGIVHRIDKHTSGLLVVAKSDIVLAQLAKQFADKTTERTYYALAWGKFKEDAGAYDGDIGRSPKNRKIYAVVRKKGKVSLTNWKVIRQYDFAALIELKLHTGRTHQIRVHCSNAHHPLLGDVDYGGDQIAYGGDIPELRHAGKKILEIVDRQMLHAKTLGFVHPITNEFMSFDSDIPDDFKKVGAVLEKIKINRTENIYDLL